MAARFERTRTWFMERVFTPILLKEVRGMMRSRRFFAAFVVFLSLLSTSVIIGLMSVWASGSMEARAAVVGFTLFAVLFFSQFYLLAVICPAFTATAITHERDTKTIDLLFTTTLTPWQIAWGKFTAGLLYSGLLLALSLPVAALIFLFGGVSPGQIFAAYGILALLAACFLAFGLMCSALSQTSRGAIGRTYAIIVLAFVMGGGYVFPFLLFFSLVFPQRNFYFPGAEPELWPISVSIIFGMVWAVAAGLVVASSRLKPFGSNRSTAQRIMTLCFISSSTLLVWLMSSYLGPWAMLAALVIFSGGLLIVGSGTAIVFSTEPVHPPRRVARRISKIRFPLLRLLFPGSTSGAIFVSLSFAAVWLVGTVLLTGKAALMFGAWGAGDVDKVRIAAFSSLAAGLPFIVFCAALGHLLVRLPTRKMARLLAFIVIVILTVFPLIHAVFTLYSFRGEGPSFLHALSPVVAQISAWDYDSYAPRHDITPSLSIDAVSAIFYMVAAGSLFIASVIWGARATSRTRTRPDKKA